MRVDHKVWQVVGGLAPVLVAEPALDVPGAVDIAALVTNTRDP